MKVVTAQQMAKIERLAYQQGYLEYDFMEQAGKGIANEIQKIVNERGILKRGLLLCGKGNNGGDAYVVGRELMRNGYHIDAYQMESITSATPLCKLEQDSFIENNGTLLNVLNFSKYDFLIDGLFGTGLKGKVREPYASIISAANKSNIPIFSVDIPSGLTDGVECWNDPTIIHATDTMFLGLPKLNFFLGEGLNYVGKLHGVQYGLPQSLIESFPTEFSFLTHDKISSLLPKTKRTRHKYERGYVTALAGSPAMPGAAILSCTAAFRGGAGIVRLFYPEGMEAELSASSPELIKESYSLEEDHSLIDGLNRGSSILIGPGIGRCAFTQQMLRSLLPRIQKPAVIDADALAFLANEDTPLSSDSILTPHKGEMEKLLKLSSHTLVTKEFLFLCRDYAQKKNITLILKGASTFIFHPGEPIYINSTGDPGMATAGSGDVLTGLLAALLAQGLSPLEAAKVGTYIHGLSGEHASLHLTSNCVMAEDLIHYFPAAFRSMKNNESID